MLAPCAYVEDLDTFNMHDKVSSHIARGWADLKPHFQSLSFLPVPPTRPKTACGHTVQVIPIT